jgi:glycosyltransferase involved in cell wall biosynthesis
MYSDNWIAYVGPFPFPWGQAGSRRMCGVARSLAESGNRIVIGGGDSLPVAETDLNEGEVDGRVRYLGLGESPGESTSLIKKSIHIFWSWGAKTVAWLDSQEIKPSHVFVYGGSAQYMLRLLPWCKRHGIPLIADVVEWYDPRQMSGGVLGPFNLSAKFALRFLYPRCDGVVAISQLLADYYEAKGCPVVRVPPTVDITRIDIGGRDPSLCDGRMRLIYAGTPGKKDLLGNIIKAAASVDPLGARLKLLVMGPTLKEVKQMMGGAELPVCAEVLGRVDQSLIADYIRSSDFSVLLREPLRFANAGFPTKFVESISNGTPVMANLTSDLGLYLHDGIEGLVCVDCSTEALIAVLNRALLLSPVELGAMRLAARDQAERSFDFRVYGKPLSDFLERICCMTALRKKRNSV